MKSVLAKMGQCIDREVQLCLGEERSRHLGNLLLSEGSLGNWRVIGRRNYCSLPNSLHVSSSLGSVSLVK